MSTTGHERRLLQKARRLRGEIEMLEAERDLQLEKAEEKSAARQLEQERLAGREQAEKNFEKLGADEIRRAITEKRLSEEDKQYAALRREILLSGYRLSEQQDKELADAHAARLARIREDTARELSELPNPEQGGLPTSPARTPEAKAERAAVQAGSEAKLERLYEKLRGVERQMEALGASAKQGELEEGVVLSIQDLKMYFGGVKAVDGLSFDVREGEIFGLIGPNGAGKTTVFNCITQFYKPTGGSLLFRGRENEVVDLTKEKVHDVILQGIVRTFQNVEVVPELTVRENLLIAGHRQFTSGIAVSALHLPKLRREEEVLRSKAEKVLDFMGLSAYADAYAIGLPYGVMKKIEIARTLMCSPRLIILDEPAAGLNDTETVELAELIRRIREEYHCTILLVEHDMGLVMDVCDRICAISFGRLLAFGTPEEIQSDPNVQQAYLGVEGD